MNLFRNILIVLILVTIFGCSMTNNQSKEVVSNQLTMITIKTETRGFSNTLILNKTQLEKLNFNDKIYEKAIDEDQWKKAVELVADLDLETLNNLKVPSTLHQSDAKKAEVLYLQLEDDVYQSPTYDEGNPPHEIKDIIAYIKGLDKMK